AHLAPLDVALRSLSLGEQATETVRAILKNALFPSVIIQTDPAWQPSDEEWERFKDQIRQYARIDRKGEPLALTGGGKASVVSLSIQQLLPSEILNRVEATVAAAFRVPPIVLQFLVGLENSPWSQMQEARRGATQDLLVPMWARDQRKLTAQLLRAPADAGRHSIRTRAARSALTWVRSRPCSPIGRTSPRWPSAWSGLPGSATSGRSWGWSRSTTTTPGTT